MLIAQVCHLGEDGDAAYRIHDPSRFLGRIQGVTTVDCHFAHGALPELARLADVLVLQFVNDWDLLTLCHSRRSRGQFTVFEANDYFFDLQPWNPISKGWANRINQELYLQLLREADAVQTSSNALAEQWRKRGAREVVVFENHIADIPELGDKPQRPLTIGWAGSPGHFADWLSIVPTLRQWLARNPLVRLGVMTNSLAHSFFDLPAERYRFVPFGSIYDYFRFLESIDIGIAPLLPTHYNRCRSDVKFLEYASRGVVGLYSNLDPYRNSVDHEKTGLLWDTPGELVRYLDRLVAEPDLGSSLRNQAYDHIADQRLLTSRIRERLDWYREKAGSTNRRAFDLVNLGAEFEPDSRYARLAPGPAESIYLESQPLTGSNGVLEKLEMAIALKPDHYAIQCLKGQFLNDMGKGGLASAVLKEACGREPQLARGWSELGRAWFRQGEIGNANKAIDEALKVNPLYLPAWQYRIRLLIHHPGAELAHHAREGLRLFPNCYSFAFVCIEGLPQAEAIEALTRLLDSLKGQIQPYEFRSALSQARKMFETLLKQGAPAKLLIPALFRAVELFPDSIWLLQNLGETLFQGDPAEAKKGLALLAKAAQLMEQSLISREELGELTTIPWEWQFAENITRNNPRDSTQSKG